MWGTLCAGDALAVQGRFIPTHVGNTAVITVSLDESTVHPHACGEHSLTEFAVKPVAGSSPRMWGTR